MLFRSDFIRDQRIEGFVAVSGDRHSFWAGYATKALPPRKFEPVGVAFVTGSISAPGLAEATEHGLKDNPLRPLFAVERKGGKYENTINLTLKHGVKSALEYSKSGDLAAAHQVSNPDNAPHLEFVDMGGHGYAVVTAGPQAVESEFVCIPRPIARDDARWRPAPLPRDAPRRAVARGRTPEAATARGRGRREAVDLTVRFRVRRFDSSSRDSLVPLGRLSAFGVESAVMDATERFSKRVEDYARYRPHYPAAVIGCP